MEINTQELNEFFDVRTVNEWIAEAKHKPVPKKLFGDLWLEGELAILFADTGKGKSLFAVQIAESIARGKPIEPFEMTAKPQSVLYLDFELSDKQFEMRYAAEHDAEKNDLLKNHHNFSNRFHRVEVRPEVMYSEDTRAFNIRLRRMIEPLVRHYKAKVLIIDNITYLKRTAESTRESAPLMKELQRLKRELGISILVIAHTPKRDSNRPIGINDLHGSKIIANFADNIFAIGQSKLDVNLRYIKHIKPRSTELVYGSAHVPTFRINRLKRRFLGFEFCGFNPESAHLKEARETAELETIRQIKKLSDEGMSIRKIAEVIQRPKSTVHYLLKMWVPEMAAEQGRGEHASTDPTMRYDHFPGKEEYDAADNDPRLDIDFDRDDVDTRFLNREHYLIQLARADARTAYKKTGIAPKLGEHEKYRAFKEAVRVYNETGVVQDAIAFMFPQEEITEDTENAELDGSAICDPQSAIAGGSLIRSLDGYGREILVEEFESNGRPRIWFRIDEKGLKRRSERKGFGIVTEIVDRRNQVSLTKDV